MVNNGHSGFLSFIVSLLLFTVSDVGAKIVTTLPGYQGTLPFRLETGYISVGEREEIALFYYFIESQGDPRVDPIFLWHTGGPGCSAFSALIYEIGPLIFDLKNIDGTFPSLLLREYDWTKLASIIFVDSPAGTGFSYDNTTKGYHSSDTEIADINYEFLRKWILCHPRFAGNPLYIAGDSYGGKIAVLVAYQVAKGILQGHEPRLALQGYIIGNAVHNSRSEYNERVPYAHRMALVSDEHYELANIACNGKYFSEPANSVCIQAVHNIKKCIDPINEANILEPSCKFETLRPVNFISMPKVEQHWCRHQDHVWSYVWASDPAVQEALGIRNVPISSWRRCHRDMSAAHHEDVTNLVKIHGFLSDQGYQSLVFSGDHDMIVPYTSTLQWIRRLNLSLSEEWRPWNVNGQVAGYMMTYKNGETLLTFATVKGAGHTAPEYKPQECYALLDRWLSSFPL